MKKKGWFAAAVAAIILVVVLLILLLVGTRQGKAVAAVPDSRYPCTVRQTKRGLLVTIDGGEDGYRWNAASDNPYAVYPTEKTTANQKSEILLSAVADGSARITVTLENVSAPYEPICQLSFLTQNEADALALVNTEYREFPGVIRDTEGRYTISGTADGSYLLCMQNGAESDWVAALENGSALVRAYQPNWSAGENDPNAEAVALVPDTCFLISDGGAEPSSIFVTDRKQGMTLELTFSHDPEGGFLLESHEMRKESDISPEAQDASAWELPVGSVLLESGSESLFSQEDGKALHTDSVCFFMDGTTWSLLRAEGVTRKALALRDYRMSDEAPDGELNMESPVWSYRVDEQWRAAWETENAAYLLSSQDADRAATEAAANILMEQQP